MKILFFFEKGESCRWLGHLDILRTFERAVRRAQLPIAFSAGFNPHEKLSFGSALPVGVTGEREPGVLELTEAIAPETLIERLNSRLPQGIQLRHAVQIADEGSKDVLNGYNHAVFLLEASAENLTEDDCIRAAERVNNSETLEIARTRDGRVRTLNLRPSIVHIRWLGIRNNRYHFAAVLYVSNEGGARTGEVAELLAVHAPTLVLKKAHRLALVPKDSWPEIMEAAAKTASPPAAGG